MLLANIFERDGYARSAGIGHSSSDGRPLGLRAAGLRRLMLLVIGAWFCSSVALRAQTSDTQTSDANTSWTATTTSQGDNANPTRTLESHTQTGNRTLDKRSVQRRGTNGSFEPYQDVETETVQVDPGTTRTTTRIYAQDVNGAKALVQVIDEERHILPGGDSKVVRATSNPDANGRLQLVQRQIEEMKKISEDVEETKATVMIPSINGGLAPARKVEERRTRGADNTVASQKTTLLPDGAGNWQVSEVRLATTRQEGKNRSTEERVSHADSERKLGEVSRTVSKQSESASGDKRNTVETYSLDIPGSSQDGSLHLVERATTVQHTGSTGQQTTEQRVEQPNLGNPSSGLQVTTVTTDTVRPGPFGAQSTRTVQARDVNGGFGIVSVDIANSNNIQGIQVQIAPSEKPK
jgi:hypothetical protein